MTRHGHLVPIDASVGDRAVTAEKGKWTEVRTGALAKPLVRLLVMGWVAWKRTSAPVSSPFVHVAAQERPKFRVVISEQSAAFSRQS